MQNGEQPIRLPNGPSHLRAGVEQRTHSGDEIENVKIKESITDCPVLKYESELIDTLCRNVMEEIDLPYH